MTEFLQKSTTCIFFALPEFFFCGPVFVCGVKNKRLFLYDACEFNFHLTSFVGKTCLIFRIIFSFGSSSNQDKKICRSVCFPCNVCIGEIEFQNGVGGFP